MIVYFADREMQVLGHATTNLPNGYVIIEDLKTEDTESGVATFSCKIGYDKENRLQLEAMTNAGNYLLRSHDNENEFYTIIDTEIDTKDQSIYVYAEDAGLDLLNEIAGEFEADETHNAEWYINKYIIDSGFEMGINEIPETTTRKLSWEGEETVTSRLASIATQFDGFEISYSFAIKGLLITNKYVNIHKKRGKDAGAQLRLNIDVDRIVTTKSVANLATAFVCEGGVPDNAEDPITLKGYSYDDGDFYVDDNGTLKSRKANEKWSRYVWNKEPNRLKGYEGYIVRPYSYNTTEQKTLCSHAVTELKKVCDMEVNFEVDINRLPESVKIGDRVNIIDDAGEMYVSTRVLKLETSIVDDKYSATLGEHIIKTSGISQKVADLAAQFAKASQSAARALTIATTAKTTADNAHAEAQAAASEAATALGTATEAQESANAAVEAANNAQAEALAAQAAVGKVESSVSSLETTVDNAKKAADNAEKAAEDATTLADEAKTAATNAQTAAGEAKTASGEAKTKAENAITQAGTAISTANTAKTNAESAIATAEAAKLDAEQAEKDVAALGENLETIRTTMSTDYARKTDLTETTANLQTQISQNAAEISSTASKVLVIDETANDAKEKAEAAQTAAGTAQAQADQATAEALAAQNAANAADAAAKAAQAEANNAKEAAEAAQGIADKAEEDLEAAKADLATVAGRVDATEEEIAAAQEAVTRAQTAADNAKADADEAALKATNAQTTANTAVTNAANAQTAANNAATKADLAQQTADQAKGDASAAQAKANEAASTAAEAQRTADTAVTNAATAQAKADQAALDATTAQQAADAADAKAAQAQTDLNTAKQNLASVTSRVDATEEEVAAAQAAVATAQAKADKAKEDAEAAQATADTAKADASNAQTVAANAKTAAENAQQAAVDAQQAADEAQAAVDSLTVRVTTAETKITQNSEKIELAATKTEVATTLSGYYTKTETDAAIQVKADSITSTVRATYTTKDEAAAEAEKAYAKANSKGEQLVANGTGLLGDNTNFSSWTFDGANANNTPGSFTMPAGYRGGVFTDEYIPIDPQNECLLSFDAKSLKGLGTLYAFLDFYDADKNQIVAGNHIFLAGTKTKLARDLVAGDTVAKVEDLSKWVTNKTYHVWLAFWNQKNSFGYTYPAETYTRNRWQMKNSNNLPTSDALDYENNCITLNSPYTGATIPAGTELSQGADGATYKYIVTNVVVPTEWTTYSGKIKGVDYSGTNVTTMFPPGVAYAKIGFLWNYNQSAGEQQWITNVTVKDATSVSAATAAKEAQQSAETANNKIDNLEIGGRNCVPVDSIDKSYFKVSTTKQFDFKAWAHPFIAANNLSQVLKPNTTYTLTYTAQLKERCSAVTVYDLRLGFMIYKSGGALINLWTNNVFTADAQVGDVHDFKHTFTTPAAWIGEEMYAYSRAWKDGTNPSQFDTFTITDFKIEEGSVPTGWSPAPEDMAEAKDVAALETRVLAAETTITQNTNQIELKASKTEVTQAVGAVEQKIDTLEIGGRNLLKDGEYDAVISEDWHELAMFDGVYYSQFGSSTVLEPGQTYTFSIIVEKVSEDDVPINLHCGSGAEGNYNLDHSGWMHNNIPFGTKIIATYTVPQNINPNYNYFAWRLRNEKQATTIRFKNAKLEKGNRATDWTPAPEDVDKSIEESAEGLRQTIAEKEASILTTAESNILTAVETNYVKNGEYTEFKETTEATLTELPDRISASFKEAKEYTDTVNGEVQAIKENLEKHFDFSLDGLTIRAGESSMTLTLDNDEIVFKKNGEEFGRWVGDTFKITKIHIGNVSIEAQRSGSVKIGKSGG